MRSYVALSLSFSFALTAPLGAAAQLVPDTVDPTVVRPDAHLLDVAGPSARVVRTDDGYVRILYGAQIVGAGALGDRAVALTTRFAHELGMPAGVTLAVDAERETHGFTIVRLARIEAGLRVRDAGAVVRFLSDGAIDLVVSSPGAARLLPGAVTLTDARARELSSTDGANGRKLSRNLIFRLTRSRFSARRGSARMLRLPSARGPNSMRP